MSGDGPMKIFPRVRGKVVERGKAFYCEFLLTVGLADGEGLTLDGTTPHLTFEDARLSLGEEAKELLAHVAKVLKTPIPLEVIDLKQGRTRSMEEAL